MATNNDTHADHYSSLSQIPLVPNKKPSPTRSFGLNTLSKLERCLVILNVGLIVILLPLVVTSVHKITKIEGMLLKTYSIQLQISHPLLIETVHVQS